MRGSICWAWRAAICLLVIGAAGCSTTRRYEGERTLRRLSVERAEGLFEAQLWNLRSAKAQRDVWLGVLEEVPRSVRREAVRERDRICTDREYVNALKRASSVIKRRVEALHAERRKYCEWMTRFPGNRGQGPESFEGSSVLGPGLQRPRD